MVIEHDVQFGPVYDRRFVKPVYSDSESDFFPATEQIGGHIVQTMIKECDPIKVSDEQLSLYAHITNAASVKAEELRLGIRFPSDTDDDLQIPVEINEILRIQRGRNGRLQTVSRFVKGAQLSTLLKEGVDSLDEGIIGQTTVDEDYWFKWFARKLTDPEVAASLRKSLERCNRVLNEHLGTSGIQITEKDIMVEVFPKVSQIKIKVTDIAPKVNDIQLIQQEDSESFLEPIGDV